MSYDSKSLIELLSKDEAILLETPENFITKAKIKYKCKCGNESQKLYQSVKQNGALCSKCNNERRNERIRRAQTGVKRPIVNPNPNQGVKRRKFTKNNLQELLSESGATIADIDSVP